MSNREHHTITDGPFTEDIEVEWTGDEFVSLTQVADGTDPQSSSVTVHVSMGQLHALGIEATKRLALRCLDADAVPLPVDSVDEENEAYQERA